MDLSRKRKPSPTDLNSDKQAKPEMKKKVHKVFDLADDQDASVNFTENTMLVPFTDTSDQGGKAEKTSKQVRMRAPVLRDSADQGGKAKKTSKQVPRMTNKPRAPVLRDTPKASADESTKYNADTESD